MEPLKHECGVAMVRLLKPLSYYEKKYGTWMYGLNKLYLLMEKQHNRGQEGAGLACVKMQAAPGEESLCFANADWEVVPSRKFLATYTDNLQGFRKNNCTMRIFPHVMCPLRAKYIWATFGILLPATVAFRMSIHFVEETTGEPRTSASAPIST